MVYAPARSVLPVAKCHRISYFPEAMVRLHPPVLVEDYSVEGFDIREHVLFVKAGQI